MNMHGCHPLAEPIRRDAFVKRPAATGLTVRVLTGADAEGLSRALLNNPPEYMRFFHPFDFDAASLERRLEAARRDIFFGIEVTTARESELAGFYMLRGLDEGYPNPMYGVFVSHAYRGQGICRLTLAHAETYCRLNHFERILLKVSPQNVRAKKLYEAFGFVYLREEPASHEVVLCKPLVDGSNWAASACEGGAPALVRTEQNTAS